MCTLASEILLTTSDDTAVLSADDFKAAFRNHPAGVAIVTADDGTGPVAMTVSSVFSLSAAPPLLVFSASTFSSSTETIRRAESVVVHLLDAEQRDLAILGATSGVNRFDGSVPWARLPTGEPHYPSAHSWVRGRVVGRVGAGASVVIFLEAVEAKLPEGDGAEPEGQPLVYHNRSWHALGEGSKLAVDPGISEANYSYQLFPWLSGFDLT